MKLIGRLICMATKHKRGKRTGVGVGKKLEYQCTRCSKRGSEMRHEPH